MHGEVMADGNYVFTGSIYDAGQEVPDWEGDEDLWIVKVSASGGVIWERSYAGMVEQDDLGIHVAPRPDGGCFVSGYRGFNDWDVWVIALDGDGQRDLGAHLWGQHHRHRPDHRCHCGMAALF
jgi:hypothetical protein